MIEYMAQLPEEEQLEITEVIRTLMRQTYLLERKYDKKTDRFIFQKEHRICSMHMEFLKEYFKIGGMELHENGQTGVIYLTGEDIMAERLSKLGTIYLLVLKLIYDEQMAQASTSIHIFTTLGDLNERVGSFGLLSERPSPTEMKRTLTMLRKYQVIDIFDSMEELEKDTRLLIYPSINMVLYGEQIQELLRSFEGDSDGSKE